MGRKLEKGVTDLATVNPELAAQWHPTKNKGLTNKKGEDISTPDNVGAGSGYKVWWQCKYGHEWETEIYNRTNGCGCPCCSGKKVIAGKDFQSLFPDISAEWDYEANKGLTDGNGRDISTPDKVSAGSKIKVGWICSNGHKWKATIYSRSNGCGCPYCAGKLPAPETSLENVNPKLAKEWHPTKNVGLTTKGGRDISTPDKVSANANQKVWWLLPYDVPMDYPVEHLRGNHYDFEWPAVISSRNAGLGCPFLSGQGVWTGFNDLKTVNPELAAQWHPTKNKGLKDKNGRDISTPDKIACAADQKVWWIEPYDDPETGLHHDFEWPAKVGHRAQGKGNPYIAGHLVWKKFNDLATKNPDLAQEWHPTKNGNLTPEDVTTGSERKVWWFLSRINASTGKVEEYEWEDSIVHRHSQKRTCPFFSASIGEEIIRKMLKNNNIPFKKQYKFTDRFFKDPKHPLRDDFAIFDKTGSVLGTIEYHGIQHYEPVDFAGKGPDWAKERLLENQERDKIKSDYLKIHNIPQLIIPYWEFDNIEKLVNDFIQELGKT